MNKINNFIENNAFLSRFYYKSYFGSSFSLGNKTISPVNNNILFDDVFIKLLSTNKIELCFTDYIDVDSIDQLMSTFNLNTLYAIDKTIVEYLNFSKYIDSVFGCKVTIRRKIIKNNSKNYDFLRKIFQYENNSKGYKDSNTLIKKDIIKTIGYKNIIGDDELIEILFCHAPYLLLDFEKYCPNYFGSINLKSLFNKINFRTIISLNFSNYFSVYAYYDQFAIMEKELINNFDEYSKIILRSDFIYDLKNNYHPYMDKAINLLEKCNYTILSHSIIHKNISKYYKIIYNYSENIKSVNINNLFYFDLSEDDLIFYYSKKKWTILALDLFINVSIKKDYQSLYLLSLRSISEQATKHVKSNIKYFVNHIDEKSKDLELIKYLLSTCDEWIYIYKVIKVLPESMKYDQEYISLLYKDKPEYKYYYFNNIYLALITIYKSTIFTNDNDLDVWKNDFELYTSACQCKTLSYYGYRKFSRDLCDEYVKMKDELTIKDLTKISYCRDLKNNSYVTLVTTKENVIKVLLTAMKYKLEWKYAFPYYKIINSDDFVEILKITKWPFLYREVPLFEKNSFDHYMCSKMATYNERMKISDQLVKNMIEYDNNDFINKLNSKFYFPFFLSTSHYDCYNYRDIQYTKTYRKYKK